MLQRFFLAIAAGVMLELGAVAVAGLLAPGAEPYAVAGCTAGLLLATMWVWNGAGLLVASALAALPAGYLAASWEAAHRLTLHSAGLVLVGTSGETGPHLAAGVAALALWLAALSAWLVFQARQPWPVATLVGSCLLLRADISVPYEDHFPLFVLGILILVGLTMAGASHLWRQMAPVAVMSVLATAIAWSLPTPSPAWSHAFMDPLRSVRHPTFQTGGAPILSLSSTFHPSDAIVMSIRVGDRQLRPYWRETVFDRYDGHSWQATQRIEHDAEPGELIDPSAAGMQQVAASIRLAQPVSDLVFPGFAMSANVPTQVFYRADNGDILSVGSARSLAAGGTYQVVAGLAGTNTASESNLGPYLQLPSMAPRVQSLAWNVARSGGALERAQRVEAYLSSSGRYHYDTKAASPLDHDAVDDFLFHSRRGYCNQFASAMAIMLREVGVPSRVVAGYATGSLSHDVFTVRMKDAHSWVEAYIPGSGWLSFEPTPGFSLDPAFSGGRVPRTTTTPQPASTSPWTQLPLPTVPAPHRTTGTVVPPGAAKPPAGVPAAGWALLLLGLLLGSVALFLRTPSPAVSYRRIVGSRAFADRPIRDGETPAEFVARLNGPAGSRSAVSLIADLYARERYGGTAATTEELRRAQRAWRQIRLRWLLGTIRMRNVRSGPGVTRSG